MLEKIYIKEIQDFFFRMMSKGWASGVKAKPLDIMPGYKGYHFTENDITLIDAYSVGADEEKSNGFTKIWYCNKLLWVMFYIGWYKKEAIPVVKAALLEAYKTNNFYCGRGANGFKKSGFRYSNYINENKLNDFTNFQCEEEVRKDVEFAELLGKHKCMGMSMF